MGVSTLLEEESTGIDARVRLLLTIGGAFFTGVSRVESAKNRQSISFANASTDFVILSSTAQAMIFLPGDFAVDISGLIFLFTTSSMI
jgi:hypothetical protein